ncbi:beta-lactamase superfamily domain-containing protein [Hygrophoropsis aurantiaca]|uniref:Beta-lactamase superfamily domain-containing protein n=1 Tax=Hygrophoropsis aurantiaca TaxID=72124 RepID=A0ACB8AKX5_9AGAM|nr:beta-lactamase superfamily domain-containing protein [Hygrophoropsis aurantiaca]
MSSLPSHHKNETRSAFDNPWPPVKTISQSLRSLIQLPFTLPVIRADPIYAHPTLKPTKRLDADFSVYQTSESDGICATWLGHAGFLVQLRPQLPTESTRILFDPIFSDFAYPSNLVNGLKRRLSAPCTIHQLPEVDYVVISHNHYDHCDTETLLALWARCTPDRPTRYLVPLGVKDTLTAAGIPEHQIIELDWWESVVYHIPLENSTIEFTCTPCQHTSGRGFLDQKCSLWSSWVVQQKSSVGSITSSVYFAGDTGYQTAVGPCPAFKEIGEKYGPFDLAMIPIWRGATLSFLGQLGYRLADETHLATTHASPEDAILLAVDVRARHSLAMHFATWAGGDDEALEPLVRLMRARKGDWQEEGGFGAIDIGESVVIPVHT